jgi:hypothetical protein
VLPRSTGFHTSCIRDWLWQTPGAHGRYVYNNNMAINGASLRTIEEFYPTIKSIMVTVNPWYAWYEVYKRQIVNTPELFLFDTSRRPTLTEFLFAKWSPYEHTTGASQKSFCQYYKNGELYQAHCIFKLENLSNDFKVIQDYFESNTPLSVPLIEDYRPYYTDASRKLIEKVFKEDIEYFGYAF